MYENGKILKQGLCAQNTWVSICTKLTIIIIINENTKLAEKFVEEFGEEVGQLLYIHHHPYQSKIFFLFPHDDH